MWLHWLQSVVYPFSSRLQWIIRGRPAHIIAAAEGAMAAYGAKRRKQLQVRMATLKRALMAQLVLFSLLYLGAATTAISWLLGRVGANADVEGALGPLPGIAASLSGVLLLAVLIVRRLIGQLEADIVMLAALRGT